jgi:hypothetical protein
MAKLKITFATVAYVQCPRHILDALSMCFNNFASGQGNVCISIEELDDQIDEDDVPHRAFLKSVAKQISGKAGDIVFHL